MTYTFQSNIAMMEFDQFARNHPQCSIMQLSSWAKVKDDWEDYRCGVYEDGVLVATGLLLVRTLPLGVAFGYLPRGPLADVEQWDLCQFFFNELKQFAMRLHLVSIKFDPNVYQTFLINQKEEAQRTRFEEMVSKLESIGMKHQGYQEDMYGSTQPRFQLGYVIPEDVFGGFPKKTREKIKIAKFSHVEIEKKDSNSVDEFYRMIAFTEKRKGIVLRNSLYFKRMMDAYDEQSVLLFAYLNQSELIKNLQQKQEELQKEYNELEDGAIKKREILGMRLKKIQRELDTAHANFEKDGGRVLISALLLIRDEQTTELLYSGLNEQYRQYFPSYALRYQAIQWAKEQGCCRFNFGGVQGNLEDGLFEFKSSFHPNIDVYVGEFDLVLQPFKFYLLEHVIPKVKQWKLHLARKGQK